jgi:hypothetical protein
MIRRSDSAGFKLPSSSSDYSSCTLSLHGLGLGTNHSIVGAPTSPLWGSIICTDFCFLRAAHLYALQCLHVSAPFCTHLYPMCPSRFHLQPPQALHLFHLVLFCIVQALCLAIHNFACLQCQPRQTRRFPCYYWERNIRSCPTSCSINARAETYWWSACR